jgi:transcriptional regulator with XRE-family HTH domain
MNGSNGSPPAARRRRLALSLRARRTDAALTQAEAARKVAWSPSKMVRIEGGRVWVSESDLRTLLAVYGVDDPAVVEELGRWAREGRHLPANQFRDVLSPAFVKQLSDESHASWLRLFENHLIPGLLQTEEFTRALMGTAGPRDLTPQHLERVIEARRFRQQVLREPQCPAMDVVLDEVVLQRSIGGSRVMLAQVDRLLELADHPRITLRIVPLARGGYRGMSTSFILLGFDDEGGNALYLEAPGAAPRHLGDHGDQAEIAHFEKEFAAISDAAASADESRRILGRTRSRLLGRRAGEP